MQDASISTAPKPSAFLAFKRDLFIWLQTFVFALFLLITCFTFLGRIISVDGDSMYPTLHDRDLLFLRCIAYTPKAGDVVVLNKPFRNMTDPIVKRIIATGGQRVHIDYETATVYVDGEALTEPYINPEEMMSLPQYESHCDMVVPEGSVFVMGDNRNHSSDSRDVMLGVIDERYIMGKANWILFPFANFGAIPYLD